MGESSLWGEEFVISQPSPQTILKKVNSPKKASSVKSSNSKLPLNIRLNEIEREVKRILGRYSDNTQVIRSRQDLTDYIDRAISNGVIAIDTETNNSLDPITCKLMGPCIYTPGLKNAYIPLNHIHCATHKRVDDQLTEQDVFEEFSRLSGTKIIMHNGKFDYQVLNCTCGLDLDIYWDTMLGAKLLNENEMRAGLKEQYRDKIDSTIEKYSIEHLFEGIEYAIVSPEIFALYAATDAFMTYKLYMWQKTQYEKAEHQKLLRLLLDVEMPVLKVAACMELTGVSIDVDYANRLSEKYHKKLAEINGEIDKQLEEYAPLIEKWRATPDAQYRERNTKPDKFGEYKYKKSKSEQLKNPPQLSSPTQFAILLYDVIGVPVIDKANPRGTGEDILKKIDNPLCDLVLQQRGVDKLIGTYIDKLPACVNEKTGRLHAHFNQVGTDTGRFSSSDPNLQNIPSHNKEIRCMFRASEEEKDTFISDDGYYDVSSYDDVLTPNGWVSAKDIKVGDILLGEDGNERVTGIELINDKFHLYVEQEIINEG